MLKFVDFLAEQSTLHMFDMDDTMFHSPNTRVGVRNQAGKIVGRLTSQQYSNHKLTPGHKYDYEEFKDSHKFHKEAQPIPKMISLVRKVHRSTKGTNSRVIINTARQDLHDRDKFLDKFRKHGIDINSIHVERAGKITGGTTAEKKMQVTRKHLNTGKYKRVNLYDDDKANLHALLQLKGEYPHVKFTAYHAQPDGSIKHYKHGD